MLIYREFVKGVLHLKDTIANAEGFIEANEFNEDTYYPMLQDIQESNDISIAEITTLKKMPVKIKLFPGDAGREVQMYVEGDWAYHLVEWSN